MTEGLHRIVVVGGGAGGLELATRLGDKLGKRRKAHIALVDRRRTHLWKPLLHEIAAGSMDRTRRIVRLAPSLDEEGHEITPQQEVPYDTLVIAIGSLTNDFNTRGVKAHAIALETAEEAERFHMRLVNACI